MLFFAIVYLVEGIGQARVGIIYQPLTHYLKETGWTALQVTAYFAVLNFPWIIKPVFGLVSDFVPLFGYRRKSYLIIASLCAVGGLCRHRPAGRARRRSPCRCCSPPTPWPPPAPCAAPCWRRTARASVSAAPSSASSGCGSTSPSWRARSPAARWSRTCPPSPPCRWPPAIAAVAPIAMVLASLFLLDEKKVGASAAGNAAHLPKPRGGVEVGKALPRRPVPVSLFLRARLRHAALLLHDRRAQILAELHRHPGRDRLGRLDRRRAGASLPAARHELEGAAARSASCSGRCRRPRSCCWPTRSPRRS